MIPAQLLVFAKPPRIGLSKTRLAAGLGAGEARRIASFLLSRTLRTAHAGPWQTKIYVSPDSQAQTQLSGLAKPTHILRPQGDGDLTDRLERGLSEAPLGPVLFIGTDAPDMTAAHIHAAIRSLRTHDAVFGPASDGGFWLFGLNKTSRTRSPFRPVRWSGPHAMEDVERNLPTDSRVACLPTLIDIDDAEDWAAWNQDRSIHKKT